jgi:thiazole synthase ThiGH ThiG subunit
MKPIEILFKSRFIACVACLFPGRKGDCMPINTALQVIRESRTNCLVYHIPTESSAIHDIAGDWGFMDLVNAISDIDEYVFLSNTSRAATAEEALAMADVSLKTFHLIKHPKNQDKPIIKLEVLDNNLNSIDDEVLKATGILIKKGADVIPLLSPNEDSIAAAIGMGVPAIRLLVGRIESMSGILNKEQISEIVKKISVPVIFEGGLRNVEDVKEAIRLGAHGVLLNTAIRKSTDPVALVKEVRKVLDLLNSNDN